MKRIALLSLIAAAVAAALAALPAAAAAESASPTPSLYAGSSVSASPGATGKLTLKIGVPEDIDGMNPFSSWSSITWESFRLNYNFLTWYDDNYKPAPDLAESWTTSADAKTWTFKIRSGVKWQDGEPLTARDVAFTYNLILDNDLDAYTSYLVGVKKVTAPDDTTLVIECEQAQRRHAGALHPHPARARLEQGAQGQARLVGQRAHDRQRPLPGRRGEARASWRAWSPTSSTSAARRPSTQILYTVYQNPDSMVQDYKAGNLDAVYSVPAAQLQALKVADGWETVNAPYIGFYELGLQLLAVAEVEGQPAAPRLPHPPRLLVGHRPAEDRRRGHVGPGRSRAPRSSRPSRRTTGSLRPTSSSPTTPRRPSRSSTRPATPTATATACARTPRATSSTSASRR